jgi:hypothetical protein
MTEYNAIELAWSSCKSYYNKNINSQPTSKDNVKNLWTEALIKCTPDEWTNYVRHVEDIIDTDWKKCIGNCTIDNTPPVIVTLGESDSEDDQYFSDEELDFTSSDNNINTMNESGPSCC